MGAAAAAFGAWLVTRRRLKRARAAERRARTAERMAAIGAMTGGLAHEIKNPLSTIGLNAQLLGEQIEEMPIPGDIRSRLLMRIGTLRREVERLRDILADFLAFAGSVRLDRAPTDVNALVSELVDFYLPEANRLGIRLTADLAKEDIVADIDARAVKQALLNLLINATQAVSGRTNPGPASDAARAASPIGEVILRTRAARDTDRSDVVRIHVVDTGPGIPPESIESVFTPYFTTKSGGSGLGLPTSRRLVDEHGGRIDVVSEVGKGTVFTVTLPRLRGAQPRPSPAV
ncbi:MAG: hypothetical protein KF745_12965 [Phycisphaeraceae bacterium]|nr:hypothetical protein [Phycisphaeraceae bacterium]